MLCPLPPVRYSICGSAIRPAVTASDSICSRSGNRMNNTANTAAAPIKTALFHIGNRPSRTPEKMNAWQSIAKALHRNDNFFLWFCCH